MHKDWQIYIVGGGTFGLSTALALVREGHSAQAITILDREAIPAVDAASTDINKIVRAEYGDDAVYSKLALDAMEVFREWNKETLLFRDTGVHFSTPSSSSDSFEGKSLATLSKLSQSPFMNFDSKHNVAMETLQQKMPLGFYNSRGGWVDSKATIKYMAEKLIGLGVNFKTGTSGTVIRLDEDGSIITSEGVTYRGTIVIAAGAWTMSLVQETRDLLTASGQAVIHFNIPKHMVAFHSPNCVWAADIANTGFYGFPANDDGELKLANHGRGCKSLLT
jgi:sarcosine oxidase / L-pipecolate oxidase